MSRVITFSRFFPKEHPRAGEPTNFVQKIWEGMPFLKSEHIPEGAKQMFDEYLFKDYDEYNIKYHTIRKGNRWMVGDKFSPRVWGDDVNLKSGRSGPYQSKQIEFAPLIEIKKIWKFEITQAEYLINGEELDRNQIEKLAGNDGLSIDDFESWFEDYPKKNEERMVGQIICWDERVEY